MKDLIPTERIEQAIFLIRGHKVILDGDLARIYGIPTKRLNEQVKRNHLRFPGDFAFQLTVDEFADLRSQSAISSSQPIDSKKDNLNRSQIATGSQKHRDPAKENTGEAPRDGQGQLIFPAMLARKPNGAAEARQLTSVALHATVELQNKL